MLVESLDGRPAPRAGPPTRAPRSTARTTLEQVPAGTAIGDLLPAVVVATDGVDLVARADRGSADDRHRQPRVSNWNLPNVLTTLRIVMVPFFGWALLVDGGDSVLWRSVACAIFALAMITDKIDGDIARARNLVTNFGKIADPIADKAITGMAFVGLSIVGDIWWWVTIVVLLREWSVTLLRLSVLKHVVIAGRQSGKVKTTPAGARAGPACLPLRQVDGALDTVGEVLFYASQALLAGAVAMTLWSGYEFFRDVRRSRRARRHLLIHRI